MTEGTTQRRRSDSWHLDKRVPIGFILALLVQSAGIVWWGAGLDGQVNDHDRRIVGLERVDDDRIDEMNAIEGRLSRLEANSAAQLETLRRIEAGLDRVIWDQRSLYRPPTEGQQP